MLVRHDRVRSFFCSSQNGDHSYHVISCVTVLQSLENENVGSPKLPAGWEGHASAMALSRADPRSACSSRYSLSLQAYVSESLLFSALGVLSNATY